MLRPRTGDFFYSKDEFDVMIEDARSFKTCGIHGIVIGILTAEGRVDVERTKLFVCFIVRLVSVLNPS
jgi:copper homeostasis protein